MFIVFLNIVQFYLEKVEVPERDSDTPNGSMAGKQHLGAGVCVCKAQSWQREGRWQVEKWAVGTSFPGSVVWYINQS